MALPCMRARSDAATSICPRWRLSAWIRKSKGPSDPLAASVASAPVTRAAWNTRSASKRPARASAVETCVPFKKARPSLGASARGARPARASASAAGSRSPSRRISPTPRRAAVMWASGREIARRADRALARDDRDEAALEAQGEMRDRRPAHAGRSLREARELQGHRQADDRRRKRFADTRRMREHEIALQRREVRLADAHARELPEARVDAVDGLALRHDGLDRPGSRLDLAPAALVERDGGAAIDPAPVGKTDGAGDQHDILGHSPLRTRACSGLKPRR